MKCQILISRKNMKNISKCLLKFLPSMQSINIAWENPVNWDDQKIIRHSIIRESTLFAQTYSANHKYIFFFYLENMKTRN